MFFIFINNLTGINDILKDMDVHMGGYDEEIGPKCASFGPLVSVFLLLFVFFTSTNHLSHFYRYY